MKRYIEVDREPIVGDMVKVVKELQAITRNGMKDYKDGDILKMVRVRDMVGSNVYYYGENVGQFLYRSEFVVVEEINKFTKSDLKPFMLVKLRKGDLCIVSQSKLGVSFNGHGFMEFSSYNDELLCFDDEQREEDYDIVEVYDISNMHYDANEFSTTNRELLFKRTELSDRDIKIKELQDKMDAIKRELEELK